MTIGEKRKALNRYCDVRESCDGCPCNPITSGWLSCGFDTSAKIEDLYAKVFPETDGEETPKIKDSGNRREFESGAVRDIQEGKGRMDLLPWAAIMEVAKHCENGAKKYGEHNVDKGIPTHSLCDSAARHLAKYLDGQTDEPHLLAAAWNLLWAVQMTVKNPELVDTPWRNEKTKGAESENE